MPGTPDEHADAAKFHAEDLQRAAGFAQNGVTAARCCYLTTKSFASDSLTSSP